MKLIYTNKVFLYLKEIYKETIVNMANRKGFPMNKRRIEETT